MHNRLLTSAYLNEVFEALFQEENLNKRYENFINEKYKGRVLTIDVDELDYQNRPKDFGFITDKIDRELFGLFNNACK